MKVMTWFFWVMMAVMLAVSLADDVGPEPVIGFNEPAGVRLLLDGVVVCDAQGDQVHAVELRNLLASNATVEAVVELLGPGHLSPLSGTGGISWYFSDGSRLTTVLWPQSLQSPVTKIKPPP